MNSSDIRRRWGIVLTFVFFVPFFSNLLHYVIIDHEYGYHSKTLEWRNDSSMHYCDQYLFKLLPAIEVPIAVINGIIVFNNFQLNEVNPHVFFTTDVEFYRFQRGPPTYIIF